MVINLWYNKCINQWRWTLTDSQANLEQHSGGQKELRVAMNDIANTVEYILDSE
tara:strand:- start:504 stop:665 length:162 start_codon:yes stop_codon:yes gene_type:complete